MGGAETPADAWSLEPSDSESDQEEEPETMGMVLKAIQNVKEDDNKYGENFLDDCELIIILLF